MNKPECDLSHLLSVRSFGAAGDGRTDDLAALNAAVAAARETGAVLELPAGDYLISDCLILDRVSLLSRGARILGRGMRVNIPAVELCDRVCVFGPLTVDYCDNGKSNHGGRCNVGMGRYEDRQSGASHCYIEDLTLTGGGMVNSNGILITGNSHDIRVDHVKIPSGSTIWRGVLCHWGNAGDHRTARNEYCADMGEKGYVHVDGWQPTLHPHDIHLGLVECEDFVHVGEGHDGDKAAVAVCACYNVEVDEIRIRNSAHAFEVTGADIGFEYASPAEKAYGEKGIHVHKIVGTDLRDIALYAVGYPWYIQRASVGLELTVDEADLSAAPGNKVGAVSLHRTDRVNVGRLTLRNFRDTPLIYACRGCRNVTVEELRGVNCTSDTVRIFTRPIDRPTENIQIKKWIFE